MMVAESLVLMRGGGDLATGIAYRLKRAGFPLLVFELPRPLVVRRPVALATAIMEGQISVEGLIGRRVNSLDDAHRLAFSEIVPVLASPELPDRGLRRPTIIIDARMAKRNIDTAINQAPLVVGIGPGFEAGIDCHAVVETKRGHWLGRVFWQGAAAPDSGVPETIAGRGAERVLRAPTDGMVDWHVEIGQLVEEGALLGKVNGRSVRAPFDGVIRGLIAPGTVVWTGLKIGDVDGRADVEACSTISDKALAIGGGVLEAIFTWMKDERAGPP